MHHENYNVNTRMHRVTLCDLDAGDTSAPLPWTTGLGYVAAVIVLAVVSLCGLVAWAVQ